MAWLESPQKLLGIALLAVVVGFSIIAASLTLLTVLTGS